MLQEDGIVYVVINGLRFTRVPAADDAMISIHTNFNRNISNIFSGAELVIGKRVD